MVDLKTTVDALEAPTRVLRVYADKQGNSCMEELPVHMAPSGGNREAPSVPAIEVRIKDYGNMRVNEWHTVPARQFAITIVGELEVEVSAGLRRRVRTGELVFLEDTWGKGHVTRMEGPVTNLFIKVPDTFDVVAWSKGEG